MTYSHRDYVTHPVLNGKKLTNVDEANQWLHLILDIGESMIKAGGEISRVEDSVYRMCRSFAIEEVDVFVITSCLIATLKDDDIGYVTQTRRVGPLRNRLDRLEDLNELSRKICDGTIDREAAETEYDRILTMPGYSHAVVGATYMIAAGAFALFFGGNLRDALAAAITGLFVFGAEHLAGRMGLNRFLSGFFCSLVGGFIDYVMVKSGIGCDFSKIGIGAIMLMIPGIPLTNSIRDMFSGDTISGMNRFIEAILLSMMIAVGFALMASMV